MMSFAWQRISIAQPLWLLVGLVLSLFVVWGWWRSLVDSSRRQQIVSLGVRLLLIASASAAAAELTWHRDTTERFVVLAVDRSRSCADVDAAHLASILASVRAAVGEDHCRVVEFGEPARDAAAAPTDDTDVPPTDLTAALALAHAALPTGYLPQIVLLSDGRETRGNVLEANLNLRGVPISTLPIAPNLHPEVQLDELIAPTDARIGEPFELTAVVQARQACEATLSLYRDGLQVESPRGSISLQAGENRIPWRQQIDAAGTVHYTVQVAAAQDHTLDDNAASARVNIAGQPRILAIDTEVDSLDSWRLALSEQQLQVEVRNPSGLPTTLDELSAFDVIALSQVAATALTSEQMDALQRYVQDWGGGFMMFGSDQSFGLGGYFKTPIDRLLPVRCDLEQEKEKPSLAMLLVIDRSGSMGGLKLKLAKDAAIGTLELLGPRDQLGLIAFDDDPHWVSSLRSAADKAVMSREIQQLTAAGGTNLYPALKQAGAALKATAARLKHVILLTDGISAPADFSGLVADLAAAQITVSAVAVGEQADRKLLTSLAQQGGGRYYDCQDPRSVPQIFAQETVMASKSAVEETPCLAQVVRASAALRGIDFDTTPVLLGRVITRAKPTSEVILATEEGDPLLVWWRSGLGMTLAFTSDVKSRWAAEWLSWPDFGRFWAQCVRHLMRAATTDRGELNVLRESGGRRLRLELADENEQFISDAQVEASILSPGNPTEARQTALSPVAPGRYELPLDTTRRGSYLVEVTARRGGQTVFQQARRLEIGYPEELRLGPVNEPLLRRIAEQTGGLFKPTATQIASLPQPPALRPVPLWRPLVMLMMGLLWLDVLLRRIDLGW